MITERELELLIDRAILAEREACALVCEKYMDDCLDDKDIKKHWPRIMRANNKYAALIRERSKVNNP